MFHSAPSLKPYSTAEPLGTHCRLPPSLQIQRFGVQTVVVLSNGPIDRTRRHLGGVYQIQSLPAGFEVLSACSEALLAGSGALPAGSEAPLAGFEALQAGSEAFPAGSEAFQAGSEAFQARSQALPAGSETLPASSL